MMEMLAFLAAPFAVCLVLVGIHGYLGLHVLLRQVIFVDLALAQIAAFGALVALVLGHSHGSVASFAFSLGATIVGAVVFTLSRMRRESVPQEAIIGITYVIATAATFLIADRAPEGGEHLRELLAGSILWATWPKVLKTALVYTVMGLFHYAFRRRFILVSEDPESAYRQGLRVRWWDFLFYVSFGIVITLAVEIAGVMMVFAYLVAPAIIALASSDRWPTRIGLAWLVGSAASALGLAVSYQLDLPSGPAIVCTLGLFLLGFAVWRRLRPAAAVDRSAPPHV